MQVRLIPIACGLVVGLGVCLGSATMAAAQSPRTRYENAQAKEPEVRELIETTGPDATPATRANVQLRVKRLTASYDAIVRRYPTSGYSDNALAQAGALHQALFDKFGRDEDKRAALDYYRRLVDQYPASSLVKKMRTEMTALSSSRAARATTPAPSVEANRLRQGSGESGRSADAKAEALALRTDSAKAPAERTDSAKASPPGADTKTPTLRADGAPGDDENPRSPTPASRPVPSTPASVGRAVLTDVQRTVLPEAVRVTLAFDREVTYREERIDGPARVFFDLPGVSATPALVDAVLDYPSDVVKQIRLGRHPDRMVRVVLDLEGVTRHSVFTLYNPFRIVIDCERPAVLRAAGVTPPSTPVAKPTAPPPPVQAPLERSSVNDEAPLKLMRETDLPSVSPAVEEMPARSVPPLVPARETASAPAAPPASPSANAAGGFSIARQLGLGVSRIVIDPGHGGRDPGVQGRGLSEAPLTLDVALRLEKLLLKEPGIEVVLTRRSDVYVPLEERTEIANREGADLFVSIHANASRNADAGGIETFYLSFASSPEAEQVAARENAASDRVMHNLPDIVKAIALNNKLDESRDFASIVQESLMARARRSNKEIRDRGVKRAPFVVLIGANMPSILAEVSFLSNRQENTLLRSGAYKDRMAEALHAGIMQYRRALKGQGKIADKDE